MKIQTLDEMEAEDPNVFKNPPVTPEEEARDKARWEKRLAEIDAMPDQLEEEEDEEDEDDEDDEA